MEVRKRFQTYVENDFSKKQLLSDITA